MATTHEHQWHVISHYVGEDGSQGAPALWSCSGRTSRGDLCIATTTKDPSHESRKAQAVAQYEREQRHTNL